MARSGHGKCHTKSQKTASQAAPGAENAGVGRRTTAIARELNLRRETLSRWKGQPEFRAAYQHLIDELREDLHVNILSVVRFAAGALRANLYSGSGDPKRVEAALKVLQSFGFVRPDAEALYSNASLCAPPPGVATASAYVTPAQRQADELERREEYLRLWKDEQFQAQLEANARLLYRANTKKE